MTFSRVWSSRRSIFAAFRHIEFKSATGESSFKTYLSNQMFFFKPKDPTPKYTSGYFQLQLKKRPLEVIFTNLHTQNKKRWEVR